MPSRVEGRVVKILNEREVAINVGSGDGVSEGMLFDVLEQEQPIYDSSAEDLLGSLQRTKVRVRVNHVQARFSVAATVRSRRVNIGGISQIGAWASLLMPADWVDRYETLRAKEHKHGLWKELDEADSLVKSGDPVVQVVDETEDESQGKHEDAPSDDQHDGLSE